MTLVKVEQLRRWFPISAGLFRRSTGNVHAVDDVDFEIAEGESLGLVGESGCGKSTMGRLLVSLDNPDSGRILLKAKDGRELDLNELKSDDLSELRRTVQMVFQDPYESLNARRTVYESVAEPLRVNNIGDLASRERAVTLMLSRVGLAPARSFLPRFPHELSGGQRQRVAIARALVLQPRLVVADEPTSMLDVSIRISIMELMSRLAKDLGVAFLYITHDLAVARYMCDRIAVMYLGKIVEVAQTEKLLSDPLHPYTKALLSAVPIPDPKGAAPEVLIKGGIGKAINPPPQCRFLDRCPESVEQCHNSDHPPLEDKGNSRMVSCYLVPRN